MHISTGPIVSADNGKTISDILDKPILFPDNSCIAESEGMERMWHFPEKLPQPVMRATKPWEKFGKYKCVGGFSGKSFVVKDGKLMMFYSIYHMGPGPEFRSFAYAESKDGINWTKPDLGDGTNLIIKNKQRPDGNGPVFPYYEMQNVIWDEHSKQYICMGHCKITTTKQGTFYGTSDSPIEWDKNNFKYAYPNEDIHALLGFCKSANGYISYPRVSINRKGARRAIGVSLSRDLKKWSDPILVHWPGTFDPLNYEIYNMPVEVIGNTLFAFPIGYRSSDNGGGSLDTEIAFTNYAADFQQPIGHIPYIPRGLPGEWDDSYVMTAAPINFGDRTLFYYWGCNFPHDVGFREEEHNEGSVGLAHLPLNRFVGLACTRHMPGIVQTCWIDCKEARNIQLNCDASRGKINVELMSITDGSYTDLGFFQHDSIRDTMAFPTPITGKIKIRFKISDAELFGFTLTK